MEVSVKSAWANDPRSSLKGLTLLYDREELMSQLKAIRQENSLTQGERERVSFLFYLVFQWFGSSERGICLTQFTNVLVNIT